MAASCPSPVRIWVTCCGVMWIVSGVGWGPAAVSQAVPVSLETGDLADVGEAHPDRRVGGGRHGHPA